MAEPTFGDVPMYASVRVDLKNKLNLCINNNRNITTGDYILRKEKIDGETVDCGISRVTGEYQGLPCNRRGPRGGLLSDAESQEHAVLLKFPYKNPLFMVSIPLEEIKSVKILKKFKFAPDGLVDKIKEI